HLVDALMLAILSTVSHCDRGRPNKHDGRGSTCHAHLTTRARPRPFRRGPRRPTGELPSAAADDVLFPWVQVVTAVVIRCALGSSTAVGCPAESLRDRVHNGAGGNTKHGGQHHSAPGGRH